MHSIKHGGSKLWPQFVSPLTPAKVHLLLSAKLKRANPRITPPLVAAPLEKESLCGILMDLKKDGKHHARYNYGNLLRLRHDLSSILIYNNHLIHRKHTYPANNCTYKSPRFRALEVARICSQLIESDNSRIHCLDFPTQDMTSQQADSLSFLELVFIRRLIHCVSTQWDLMRDLRLLRRMSCQVSTRPVLLGEFRCYHK